MCADYFDTIRLLLLSGFPVSVELHYLDLWPEIHRFPPVFPEMLRGRCYRQNVYSTCVSLIHPDYLEQVMAGQLLLQYFVETRGVYWGG